MSQPAFGLTSETCENGVGGAAEALEGWFVGVRKNPEPPIPILWCLIGDGTPVHAQRLVTDYYLETD
jgi:hypothetical protein